jgi:hypothetical protein
MAKITNWEIVDSTEFNGKNFDVIKRYQFSHLERRSMLSQAECSILDGLSLARTKVTIPVLSVHFELNDYLFICDSSVALMSFIEKMSEYTHGKIVLLTHSNYDEAYDWAKMLLGSEKDAYYQIVTRHN